MTSKNVARAFASFCANEDVQVGKITILAPSQQPTTPHSQSLNLLLCQECIQKLPHTGRALCIIFHIANGNTGIFLTTLTENIILKRNSHSFTRQGVIQCFCDANKRITDRSSQSQVVWPHLDMVTRLESSFHNPTIQE